MGCSASIFDLNFGSAVSHLSDEAYLSVKEKLVQDVSKAIGLKLPDVADITLRKNRLIVHFINDDIKEVDLTQNQAKRVSKILARAIGFVRNTSSFEYGSDHRKEALFTLNPPPATFKTSLQSFVLGPLGKGLSLFRDGVAAFSLKAAKGTVAKSCGTVAGVIDLADGFDAYRDASKEMVESWALRDNEGYQRAEAKLVQSELQLGAGALFIGQSVTTFAAPSLSGAAAAACVPLIFLFSTIGTVIGLSLSIFGIQRCNTFLQQLDEYLENPHLSEEQQISGALRFLQEQISISPEEEAELEERFGENKEKIEEETRLLLENKVRHFKRRTSLQSLDLIASKSSTLLVNIEYFDTRAEGIRQARELIGQVRRASCNKRLLYSVGLFAILLGFGALIAGIILTGGLLALAIGLGAGAVCFGLALHSWLGTRKYRLSDPEAEKQPELVCDSSA